MITFSLKSRRLNGNPARLYIRAEMHENNRLMCGVADYVVLRDPTDEAPLAARHLFADFLRERASFGEIADAVLVDDTLYNAVCDIIPQPQEIAA